MSQLKGFTLQFSEQRIRATDRTLKRNADRLNTSYLILHLIQI